MRPTNGSARNDRGYTIIELAIVVMCIAILAAMAVPRMSGYILQGHLDGAKPYLQELATKQRMYKIENGSYCCSTSTLDENNLNSALGLSVANTGDFCVAFICRNALSCQSAVTNSFISPIASGVSQPDFEIWAILRSTSSGAVAGPGSLSCTPITGKQSPTGWVNASTATTSAGRTGEAVVLRYPPPTNGPDASQGTYHAITFNWLDGVSSSDAMYP
jgi:prepilin-type N-terminal cleavage/methylation domain-containing protein